MYKTGHSNLKVKMQEIGADLACEVSGHVFFKNRYFGYDDAIYATLRMLELVHDGIDLDAELAKLPQVFSTEEIKVKTTEAEKFKIIDKVKEFLKTLLHLSLLSKTSLMSMACVSTLRMDGDLYELQTQRLSW